jgi:hypothetical protein
MPTASVKLIILSVCAAIPFRGLHPVADFDNQSARQKKVSSSIPSGTIPSTSFPNRLIAEICDGMAALRRDGAAVHHIH